MTLIRFHIPGTPVAKGRARVTTRGGRPATYTPAKTVAYEGLVALAGQDAIRSTMHSITSRIVSFGWRPRNTAT